MIAGLIILILSVWLACALWAAANLNRCCDELRGAMVKSVDEIEAGRQFEALEILEDALEARA